MTPLSGAAAAPLLAALHAAADPAAWDQAAFASLLDLPGCFAFAEAEGFVLARVAADEAEILMLAVLPAARRQGLGRRLLRAAAREAALRGAAALYLEVAATNLPARALYDGAGFAEVGRRKRYYPDGADAIVMRLTPAACGS